MFPPVGYTLPSLQLHQFSYASLTFGGNVPGSPYQIQSASGLFDQPDVLSGDVQRDLDQGEFGGLDVLPGRIITMQLVVIADGTSFDHARQQLGGALAVGGTREQPLFMQLASGLYACMARPRKYVCPYDLNAAQAQAAIASVMFKATDPRWYAAPSRAVSIAPGANGTVYNNGLFEMRPIFVVSGPLTNPVITNTSIAGAPSIGFTCTLLTGDTLTIDTQARSAVYLASGSSTGQSIAATKTVGTTWFNLPPGASILSFAAATHSGASGLVVQSADAWLAV